MSTTPNSPMQSDSSRIIEYPKPGLPNLVPFPVAGGPTLDLSVAIPANLAFYLRFIVACADFLQMAVEAVATLANGIVSLACARAYEVELSPDWREPSPLWFVVLAEPGERKSAMVRLLTLPLRDWQAEERQRLKYPLAKHAEDKEVLIARQKGIRSQIGKADPIELDALKVEAETIASELSTMPELMAPELITADATPEAIRDLLIRNGEKLGLVSAETDAHQLMGDRYAEGPNLNLLLAAHAGDPAPAHRVGKDMPMDRPALGIVLFVQPDALSPVLRDPVALGRGLVSRMLLISPTSLMGSRQLTPPPVPDDLRAWWSNAVREILNRPWPGRVVVNNATVQRSDAPPRVLGLAPGAREVFLRLQGDVEARLKPDGDLKPISGFGSKLPGAVARIALALQVLHDPNSAEIDAPTMAAACSWAPFLIGQFKFVAGVAAESVSMKYARKLVAALRRLGIREVTEREAFRLIDGASDMETMEHFRPVAEILVERNYLIAAPEASGKPGRPKGTKYSVHPDVFL